MPAGFPKGQAAYTNAKVIVARAFPPPTPAWRHAGKPFDPRELRARHARGRDRGRQPGAAPSDGRRLGHRATRVHRQLQGADRADARGRTGRQRAGDRGRHRSGRARRHGRDQPLARRARDRAQPRPRRRSGGGRHARRRRGDDCGRQRLRRVRPRLDRLTGHRVERDHGRAPSTQAPIGRASRRPGRRRCRSGSSRRSPRRACDILSSVPTAWAAGRSSTARAWPRRTSPALPRSCASATRAGPGAGEVGARRTAGHSTTAGGATRQGAGMVALTRAHEPRVLATPAVVSLGLLRPGATARATARLADAGGGAGPWARLSARPGRARATVPSSRRRSRCRAR